MKIAQIAPLYERVPPKFYGGTERVVAYLTEQLVRDGHEVTLFASGDSRTSAELVSPCRSALRLEPNVRDPIAYHLLMLDEVRRQADRFDILHFHVDMLHYPLMRDYEDRIVTTLHGRLDLPDLKPFYRRFPGFPLVSISDHQRRPMVPVNWVGTVYHGLPRDLLPFYPDSEGGYLAFLGRISPEKRPDEAIRIAAAAGLPLKIAAKVDPVDDEYWRDVIAPLIAKHANVEYVGEIDEHQKAEFLGKARALLFPIDWPEPFGLVMVEAMACGTPVVAMDRGSVPEIIDDGISGLIVKTREEAVTAVRNIDRLSRHAVRRKFEDRFTADRMAAEYAAVYERIIGIAAPSLSPALVAAASLSTS